MKRWIAGLMVLAGLVFSSTASAHNGGGSVWDARGTSATVSCDQANLAVSWFWHANATQMGAIGGYPTIQRCTHRINSSAVGGYSVAFCSYSYYCQASGVHDWVFDRDSSRAGYPGAVYIITTHHR